MTDQASPGNCAPPVSRGKRLMLYVHAELKDGEWHDWEEVVNAVWPKVPRGAAFRKNESERKRLHRKRHGPNSQPARRKMTEAHIRSGANTLLKEAVRSWRKWIEWDGDKVRLLATPKALAPYIDPKDHLTGST